MELPYEEKKINFIVFIYTTFGQSLTGGLLVLHKLAYELAVRGHNVYTFCKPEFPHENIKVINSFYNKNEDGAYVISWETFSFPYKNTVTIYPQITRYNPIGTQNVARWILYDTQEDIESTYGEEDVYFNYNNFKTFKNKEHLKLTTSNFFLDLFQNKNLTKRKKFCHLLHKHTPPDGEKVLQYLNSESLDNWKEMGGHEYLAKKFNEYEYFITYDQVSFFPVLAVLCGTKTIILTKGDRYEPQSNAFTESEDGKKTLSPTEYRLKHPLYLFGVAYGWSDIEWAEKTIGLSREYLIEIEKLENKSVDSFVNYWVQKIFN